MMQFGVIETHRAVFSVFRKQIGKVGLLHTRPLRLNPQHLFNGQVWCVE